MALLGKKPTRLIGVDISSTAVKLLELGKQDTRYKVLAYAVEPLPPNAVVEKSIANPEAVADTIRSALKRAQTKTKTAAVAVPGSAAISKTLILPADLSDEEMEAQIELQADQYIPYPLDEVNTDFQVIGPAATNPNEVEVLLVASRSENVEARLDCISSAGLTAKIVDVESYAMETAFELVAPTLPCPPDSTLALIDVGATMTTLTVLEEGRIVYTREQVFGGKQLTEEIMRRYGLSYEEAGRAKRQGGLPDNYEEEVLEPFKEAMGQQVSRSLQFFFGASQHNAVEHIVLCGGCASIPGITEIIAERTGTETSTANPFNDMAVASRIRPQMLAEDAPALMIACGLAMRSFD
ncbi:pilus assembly protein PilM [Ectothiorhodospiraceae bacterium WFHF3C12]|nr:pilus assembly protein PilM [Ectothiorhodospiraceae bacterium WFHF3C12]